MNDKSKWWDKSITLIEGCSPISEGCKNCWSAGMAHRFHGSKGLTTEGHYNGKIICREDRLKELMCEEPTRWTIWNDLFHKGVNGVFRGKLFNVIRKTPQHTYFILTKRIERMAKVARMVAKDENVWWGVTVCNQAEADEKIPILLQMPAAHRFVCLEPLLEKIDLSHILDNAFIPGIRILLDWVIVGCESINGWAGRFRGGYAAAALDIFRQCEAAGIPVWHKQMPVGRRVSRNPAEWDNKFRVRATDGKADQAE